MSRFSEVAAPLIALTKKRTWTWGDAEQGAFQKFKDALTTAPVLTCPNLTLPFTLQTDASAQGLGAVITQKFHEEKSVIVYASRTVNSAERNYSATEIECLAVVKDITSS